MRIIPLPGSNADRPDDSWHTELEAALTGDRQDAATDWWRELRDDVRALAPPMAPDFEHQLKAQITEWASPHRPRKARRLAILGASAVDPPIRSTIPADSTESIPGPARAPRQRPGHRVSWLRAPSRHRIGALAATIGAVLAALIVVSPWQSGTPGEPTAQSTHSTVHRDSIPFGSTSARRAAGAGTSSAATAAPAERVSSPLGEGASAPGRVQQLAASITLTATPSKVQETSDRVARLAVGDEGFVERSHVQVQQGATSEASLMLRLPSATLSAALASLGRLAPVSAESQSLQDITGAYNAARRRLADAKAQRQALLRALSAATTEGQIDSLDRRLSQARGEITQAGSALQKVSDRASTAAVEVTIVGDAHTTSEGLTVRHGLHDAGRVLTIGLVVILLAAAVLLPLAGLLAALAAAHRAWRRYQHERALGSAHKT